VYVAPISLAGIRNPQQEETHALQQERVDAFTLPAGTASLSGE
jgi:hypothetical protein